MNVREWISQVGDLYLLYIDEFKTICLNVREWISPATVTYLMNQLITNDEYKDLVRQYDFFILPVTNPDG